MPENSRKNAKRDEPNEFVQKIEEYKEKIKKEAEGLVKERFPRTVLELNDLANDPKFDRKRVDEMGEDLGIPIPEIPASGENCAPPAKKTKLDPSSDGIIQGTKVLGFVGGSVRCNKKIEELVDIVKPLVRQAVDDVNMVKMWISFLIPRIEDGNNFGVSIQEDTLAEVRTVEAEAASFLDAISRYFINRGRLVTKVAKYPHVDDFRRSVVDLDEKQFINLRLVVIELRNHYSTLHDVITKNMEKIIKPRSSNTEMLY